MKYSYVALSAMALASSATAAPLGSAFFGTQDQTMNENAGIMNVDRRDFTENIGVGNGVSDGSNVDVGGGSKIKITAKPMMAASQQKRSPLMSLSFGTQKAKGNSNAGIMTVDRRGDTENYGVGNGVTDASNVGVDGGSVIHISRRGDTENYGVGNGVTDGSNVGVSGGSEISIGKRGDTISYGVGNGVSDASNVDIGGGSDIHISRRGDTENYGVGNGVSDGSNVGVSGGSQISIGKRGDTENYGVGNGVSDASNVDISGGSSITIGKRSPLMDFKFGTDSQKVNSNAGIMTVERRGDTENIGVGNDVSDGSNVDVGGGSKITITAHPMGKRLISAGSSSTTQNQNGGIAHIPASMYESMMAQKGGATTQQQKRLISAGSSSTTQNQNGGIAHIPKEMYAQMMAQKQQQPQRRSMTHNIGVGNGVSDGSNVGVSDSAITISARDTENYGVGNGVSDGSNVGVDDSYISIHDRDLLA